MSGRGVWQRARARLRRFPELLAGCGEQVRPGRAGAARGCSRCSGCLVPRRQLPTGGAWRRRRPGRRSCGGTSVCGSSGRCGTAWPGRRRRRRRDRSGDRGDHSDRSDRSDRAAVK